MSALKQETLCPQLPSFSTVFKEYQRTGVVSPRVSDMSCGIAFNARPLQHVSTLPSATICTSNEAAIQQLSFQVSTKAVRVIVNNKHSTSRNPVKRNSNRRKCGVQECPNGAQSGGFCKSHGGGQRCEITGCRSSAQRKGRCRVHGGGKSCVVEGCTKAVQRFNRCHRHGGVRTCKAEGCEKKDRGLGFCVLHGGGSRCSIEGCSRLARKNKLCSKHLQ